MKGSTPTSLIGYGEGCWCCSRSQFRLLVAEDTSEDQPSLPRNFSAVVSRRDLARCVYLQLEQERPPKSHTLQLPSRPDESISILKQPLPILVTLYESLSIAIFNPADQSVAYFLLFYLERVAPQPWQILSWTTQFSTIMERILTILNPFQ